MTPAQIQDIVRFSTEAAREQIAYAIFSGEEPDVEGGMGLWQSFQAAFPKELFSSDWDAAVTLYATTYSEAVKSFKDLFGRAEKMYSEIFCRREVAEVLKWEQALECPTQISRREYHQRRFEEATERLNVARRLAREDFSRRVYPGRGA